MKKNIDFLKDLGIKIFIIIFSVNTLLVFIFQKRISREFMLNILSLSIFITLLFIILLDKCLWKKMLLFVSRYDCLWCLFEKYEVPILKNKYECLIKYEWPKGSPGEKKASIEVKQTYTSIDITLITDEIRSDSIVSEIVKQDNIFILFYIYKTNPKAIFHKNNPPQLGGCKIILDFITDNASNDTLDGKYWTTSETIGDMELY